VDGGFEPGAWSLGRHHRWINAMIAIAWVAFISIVFMLPTTPAGTPWRSAFDLNFANYAPVTIGTALLLFGGWYALSGRKWSPDPYRWARRRNWRRSRRHRHFRIFARSSASPPFLT
jgi:hypothetical protein